MTAVAVAPLGRTEVLQWLAPAPLWDGNAPGSADFTAPWIAELRSDAFADDFTGMLAAQGGASPSDLAGLEPEVRVGDVAEAPYRLFQPLSQRYYLVAAELVCRRPGIPDHEVRPALQERVCFVMRRLTADGGEEAFVAGPGQTGGWVAAGADPVAGEQDYPMFPARIAPYAAAGTTTARLGLQAETGAGRTLFFGYVPVGIREQLVRPMADPAQALADLRATPAPPGGWPDPIHSWLHARVIDPWSRLTMPAPPVPNPAYASLFLLLDLGDWLDQHLQQVYEAVLGGGSLTGAYDALLDGLEGVSVPRSSGGSITLRQAVRDTAPYRELLTGADVPGPTVEYRLQSATNLGTWLAGPTTSGSLSKLAKDALAVNPVAATVPPELEGLIMERAVPPPGSPPGADTTYVIRTVFHHEPCRPVVSEPSHPFELARALDPDAPARKILLQMPDITHLRKYQRGVAIEMPPALQRVIDRVTPEMLKGDGLGPDGGVALGWICSFSLQIIFLVAFIVMFIFLLLLNFVFWWMAFLKICFPVPVPAQSNKGPTP